MTTATQNQKPTSEAIARRIDGLPRLASLRSINMALGELLNADYSFTSQIAEIIRRDPSLTSRILKLVNSVFYGLSRRIYKIEDAVFYLGLRQIRELALATPIIEELENLNKTDNDINWRELWQHNIGTAILTREVFSLVNSRRDDEADYIAGLVHNVGKIVMAFAYPEEFRAINKLKYKTTEDVCRHERDTIGWDHAEFGAYYLEKHRLSPETVEAVRYHNNPESAPSKSKVCAAIQIADHMVRSVGIMGVEQTLLIEETAWTELSGWKILFGDNSQESNLEVASLRHTLARLPGILSGMIV